MLTSSGKYIPSCLVWLIAEYASDDVLLDWIIPEKLELGGLAINPHYKAIEMIKSELSALDDEHARAIISAMSSNTHEDALRMLLSDKNAKLVDWKLLSANPHPMAVEYILRKENRKFIDWSYLSENFHHDAMTLLLENPDKICWIHFSKNPNPVAVRMLAGDIKRVNYSYLSVNLSNLAFEILMIVGGVDPSVIDFTSLSANPNQRAFEFLIKNATHQPDIINWELFCGNYNDNAIEVIRNNMDYIDWWGLSSNPHIFRETTSEVYVALLD